MAKRVLVSSAKKRRSDILEDSLISFMYNINKIGPSTLPCGTPHVIKFLSESTLPVLTFWYLSVKYDRNQLLDKPLIP